MALETPVLVIGGGLSGLVCAYELAQHLPGRDVHVIEAGDRAGGLIHSEYDSGYRIEWAANGFPDRAPLTFDLVRRLGIEDKLEPSSDAARKRFLYRSGKLHLIPTSPLAFLASPVLSMRGRMRAAMEPFAPGPPAGDETVYDFARRRLGEEAADILVDAFVSGVFAGNSKNLSLQSAFPFLKCLEDQDGGLVRGLIRAQRKARHAARHGSPTASNDRASAFPPGERRPERSALLGRLTSFRDGMGTLTEALAEALGERLRLATRARSIERRPGPHGGYTIQLGSGEPISAQAVVLAVPPIAAAQLLHPLDAALGEELASIPTAPISVVATGFLAGSLPAPLNGFGFLVPRGQGLRMLGCLWDSSIYRFRAPVGRVLLRTLIGGAHDPEAAHLEESELLAIVRHELGTVLGLTAEPDLVRVIRHRGGIPQYPPGHSERLGRIGGRLAAHPGIHLTGCAYHGVAINRVIDDARATVERVTEFLTPPLPAKPVPR